MSFATSEFQKLQNFSSVMCSSFVILGCSELLEILELRNFGIPRMTRLMTRLILRLWVFRKCCNACNRPMSCERLVLRGVSMQMYACVYVCAFICGERERVCVYIYATYNLILYTLRSEIRIYLATYVFYKQTYTYFQIYTCTHTHKIHTLVRKDAYGS